MPAAEMDLGIDNISAVAGRYVLGHQARRPGVNILACRLRAISPTGFTAAAPVIGAVGEEVSASFAPFGTLHGHILRHVADGFAVELDGGADVADALADRIEAFRHRTWHGMADRRAAKRFMPAEPRSVLILEHGTVLPCLIVDYSASSAAVSADIHPPVGASVTVGQVPARVVRQFDVGFAVHFEVPPAEELEAMLETPPEWRNAVAVVPPQHIDTSEPDDTPAEGYGYD